MRQRAGGRQQAGGGGGRRRTTHSGGGGCRPRGGAQVTKGMKVPIQSSQLSFLPVHLWAQEGGRQPGRIVKHAQRTGGGAAARRRHGRHPTCCAPRAGRSWPPAAATHPRCSEGAPSSPPAAGPAAARPQPWRVLLAVHSAARAGPELCLSFQLAVRRPPHACRGGEALCRQGPARTDGAHVPYRRFICACSACPAMGTQPPEAGSVQEPSRERQPANGCSTRAVPQLLPANQPTMRLSQVGGATIGCLRAFAASRRPLEGAGWAARRLPPAVCMPPCMPPTFAALRAMV